MFHRKKKVSAFWRWERERERSVRESHGGPCGSMNLFSPFLSAPTSFFLMPRLPFMNSVWSRRRKRGRRRSTFQKKSKRISKIFSSWLPAFFFFFTRSVFFFFFVNLTSKKRWHSDRVNGASLYTPKRRKIDRFSTEVRLSICANMQKEIWRISGSL